MVAIVSIPSRSAMARIEGWVRIVYAVDSLRWIRRLRDVLCLATRPRWMVEVFPILMTNMLWQRPLLRGADVIVTADIRDFPKGAMRCLGLAVMSPDELLLRLL